MTRKSSFGRIIPYKDTNAWPGSELHKLLTDLESEKDPKKAAELRKKAEQCHAETTARYKKSIGETA